jgi:hypothetical protein
VVSSFWTFLTDLGLDVLVGEFDCRAQRFVDPLGHLPGAEAKDSGVDAKIGQPQLTVDNDLDGAGLIADREGLGAHPLDLPVE